MRIDLMRAAALTCALAMPTIAQCQRVQSIDERQTLVPDNVRCRRCAIQAILVARIGDDQPGAVPIESPQRVWHDQLGRYWLLQGPGRLASVYNKEGRFIGNVGVIGDGPGEFRFIRDVAALPGDSVLLVDAGGSGVVVDRALRVTRHITFPGADIWGAAVNRWPTEVLLSGHGGTAESVGWPLHTFDASRSPAVHRRSFGPGTGELRPSTADRLRSIQHVWVARPDVWWTADLTQYRLFQWNKGAVASVFRRRPDWFAQVSRPSIGGPATPPEPFVGGLYSDEQGLVWVFVEVAAPGYRRAWGAVPSNLTGEVNAAAIDLSSLYTTRIEVLNPLGKYVLTRGELPGRLISTVGHGMVAIQQPLEKGGSASLRIYRLQIQH